MPTSKLTYGDIIKKAKKIKLDGGKEADKLLNDGNGLFLRVLSESKIWLFIFTFEGKRRKQVLGRYPSLTLAMAREAADESRRLIARGLDPIAHQARLKAQREASEAAAARRLRFKDLFEDWHAKEAAKRKDGGYEVRRAIEKDVLPFIGDLYADETKRRDIMGVLGRIKDRGAMRHANMVLQYLRQMFKYAAWWEIVSADPTFGLNKKVVGGI